MASFTSAGDTTTLRVKQIGETVRVALSGTYNMTIALQRETQKGSGAWTTLKTWTTANATVAYDHTTDRVNESLRLIVLVDTSGTCVATLTETSDLDEHTWKDRGGNTLAKLTQSGAVFYGDVDVVGETNGVPSAEIQCVDPSQKFVLFEDFYGTWAIGDAGPADTWSSTAGGGTANAAATTVVNSVNGEVTLKSASDDGNHAANCSTFTGLSLGFKANKGGLALETKIKVDDVSEAVLFVGFTDAISTTVELPIFMNAAAIDSDAADACGVIYDVDATTDKFYVGGVKANTDTDPVADNAVVPVDDTYVTIRVEVSATGVVTGWVDGTLIGTAADAVTITTALTPAIVIGNRSANQVVATLDYIKVEQDR